MDEEYDAIVLGTGLKECILSGMLSVSGKKVLHMDRNKYYGGESASLSPLDKVFEHFDMPGNMDKEYGVSKNWNVDLIPKFLMANGQLVKLLIHTGVTRYLEFKSIEGSYFYKGEKIYKIPASESEAIRTSLMGIFEKRRYKNLLAYVLAFEKDDPSTWKKLKPEDTVEDLFKSSGVDKNTQDLTGHALALYRNEDYKQEEMWKFIAKMKLYCESLTRYGKSPYLYPLYGLGELPQAFAILSAIYGGTYMLNKSDIKIVCDENGEVSGVEAADEDKKKETAKTKMIVCDPTYALDKCQKVGQVVRAICILDHPIPDTDGSNSTQVIIPQNQVGRTHDIYISCVSNTNMVADKGYFLATASTTVETKEPEEELKTAFKVMGPILQKFVSISDLYEPKPTKNQLFITSSYDATSHFETTCTDVLSLFEKITGGPFDFSLVKNAEDIEQC